MASNTEVIIGKAFVGLAAFFLIGWVLILTVTTGSLVGSYFSYKAGSNTSGTSKVVYNILGTFLLLVGLMAFVHFFGIYRFN